MLDSSGFGLPAPAASESSLVFAARRLRQACIACELAPGTFIHEAELARRFGLGRAAVRVALTELAAAGFVARHARQGWRVAGIDGGLATSVVEGRRLLEPALADAVLDEGQRAHLRNGCAMMEAIGGREDAQARAIAHRLRRQALDLLAGKTAPLVAAWLRELWDHAERLARALEFAGRPVAIGDLRPFWEALLAGDRQAALSALAADQERFRAAVADAFLGAAQLAPSQPRPPMRKRRTGGTGLQPSPSPTVKEETSR